MEATCAVVRNVVRMARVALLNFVHEQALRLCSFENLKKPLVLPRPQHLVPLEAVCSIQTVVTCVILSRTWPLERTWIEGLVNSEVLTETSARSEVDFVDSPLPPAWISHR